MRTNIEIGDRLMAEALAVSGLKTKKAAVEEGLQLLVQRKSSKIFESCGESSIGKETLNG